MGSNYLSVLRSRIIQDPLYKIVAILVAGNINQWDACPVVAPLANPIQVTAKEIRSSNFEALFNNLGRELIRRIFGSKSNHMVNCSASIGRPTVLANVLDAPVAKLAVRDDVNVGQDLFDTRTL
jgi:uncharacterized metal-binding protein